jgi:hypothetical protein
VVDSGHVFISLQGLVGERPNRQLGTIGHSELAKNSIQILLDGAFGEVQFISNLFVELGLGNQVDYLPFPKAEFGVEWSLPRLGAPTTRANSVPPFATELEPASEAVSQRRRSLEFNSAHQLVHSCQNRMLEHILFSDHSWDVPKASFKGNAGFETESSAILAPAAISL